MAQLRQNHQKYVDRDAEVIAVGPEDAKAFALWWHEHEMPFIGIPDPEHVISKLYSQRFNLLKGGRLPALIVINKQGKVRLRHYADAMSDIPSEGEILALLDSLNAEAQNPAVPT